MNSYIKTAATVPIEHCVQYFLNTFVFFILVVFILIVLH